MTTSNSVSDEEGIEFSDIGNKLLNSEPVTNTMLPFELAFGIFITSSICDKCLKKKADLKCTVCNTYLCFDCFPVYHQEHKTKDDHMKFAIKANVPYEEVKKRGIKCQIHSMDVEYYDTKAKTLVCEKCLESNDSESIVPIEEAFPQMDQTLDQKISLNSKRIKLYKVRNQRMTKFLNLMIHQLEANQESINALEHNNYKHSNPVKSWKELKNVESEIQHLFEDESKMIQNNYYRLKAIDKESPYYKIQEETSVLSPRSQSVDVVRLNQQTDHLKKDDKKGQNSISLMDIKK